MKFYSHGNLPVPGSGVVGGSGVVSLLLKDSPFSSFLFCPLRLDCFLRVLRLVALFLLLFRFFGRSIFSVTLTVFLPSVSSSDDGSYDLLDTSRSSCSSLLTCEMVRYFDLPSDSDIKIFKIPDSRHPNNDMTSSTRRPS